MGQGGGEDPTQTVTSPTAPEVAAPAAPKSARRIPRWLLISTVALVVLVALGAAGYVTLGRSLAAKEAAAVSIAAAKVAVQEANTAAEPGSEALDESQKSEAALDEARSLYSEGYLVRIGRYRAAASKADEARKTARAITAEVEALAADASIADSNEAVGLYFALYEKYPRTHEGRAALPRASEVLLAIAALSTVEAARYRPVLVLLRDCSKLGEKCTKVANSPTRSTKKAQYFSSRQISTVDKLTKQMDAKLDKARSQLKRL